MIAGSHTFIFNYKMWSLPKNTPSIRLGIRTLYFFCSSGKAQLLGNTAENHETGSDRNMP